MDSMSGDRRRVCMGKLHFQGVTGRGKAAQNGAYIYDEHEAYEAA
jgi:hypothetical protein